MKVLSFLTLLTFEFLAVIEEEQPVWPAAALAVPAQPFWCWP
jgi:hypothetical protein